MDINSSIANSFKWSVLSEIIIKLITPVLNAILARILLPDDYAPLATIMMLISFCEIFVESGFRKYLIQHQFDNENEEKKAFHVSFWTTLGISLFLWSIITVFSKPISSFLGNSDIWLAVAVSGCILPIYAMTGIFNASIHKQLEFKRIFFVRVIPSLIPLFITIPLAVIGMKYWALLIGNIASVSAQLLVAKQQSKYKVECFYSFSLLRMMISDTMWTLVDGFAVWLTAWVDSLLITQSMSDYYLGLYKNSLTTVTSLFSMVSASIVPVLFVGLTKYQKDDKKFSTLFLQTQQILALLLIPMGVGVFIYQDLAVSVLFGNKWGEAAGVVGITALTLSLRTAYVSICSDAYRAKGKFRTPFILQIVDLCILIPSCIISAQYGFWCLVYVRSFERLLLIIPEFLIMKKNLRIDIREQFNRQWPIWLSTIVMSAFCFVMKRITEGVMWDILTIVGACFVYLIVLCLFPSSKQLIKSVVKKGADHR